MRNFKYNHKRNRFRSNGDRSMRNNHMNKDGFQFIDGLDQKRRNFSKQNQNCAKLIDKYNDLAREALSKGDKITSENYFQHADHFSRILSERENNRLLKDKENNSTEETSENVDLSTKQEEVSEKQAIKN